jgi:hypothetical protein
MAWTLARGSRLPSGVAHVSAPVVSRGTANIGVQVGALAGSGDPATTEGDPASAESCRNYDWPVLRQIADTQLTPIRYKRTLYPVGLLALPLREKNRCPNPFPSRPVASSPRRFRSRLPASKGLGDLPTRRPSSPAGARPWLGSFPREGFPGERSSNGSPQEMEADVKPWLSTPSGRLVEREEP